VRRRTASLVLIVFMAAARDVRAQQLSTWLDASAARAQPPANVTGQATSYGLLGLRMRVDGTRASAFEAALYGGRGAEDGSGTWASGSASGETMRNLGMLAVGGRADVFALRYLQALRTADGSATKQGVAALSARPILGLSLGRTLFRAEGDLTRGAWRSEVQSGSMLGGGGGGPLGGLGQPPASPLGDAEVTTGDIAVTGGALSLTRVLQRATLQVTAESYNATNQLNTDGVYRGIGGTAMYSTGSIDLAAGVRQWSAPQLGSSETKNELGYHAAIGAAVGQSMYARLALTRSVTDPMYGTAGSTGVSLGMSVRLGSKRVGGAVPAVELRGATSGGRKVVFRLRDARASKVAVAGDFTGWQPRAMRRAGEVWETELVLPEGVHHFSFVVDGDRWTVPADAPGVVDDGFGRKNATVVVQG
jgi:hypothetical protein